MPETCKQPTDRRGASDLRHRLWVVAVVFSGLLLTAVGYRHDRAQLRLRQETRFQWEASRSRDALLESLRDCQRVVESSTGIFAASDLVEPEEWATFQDILVRSARAPGLGELRLLEGSVGQDPGIDPALRRTLLGVAESGTCRVTLRPLPGTPGEAATSVTMIVPVFAKAPPPGSADGHRRTLTGWVAAPVYLDQIVRGFPSVQSALIDVEVCVRSPGDGDTLLFDLAQVDRGEGSCARRCASTDTLRIAGLTWTLRCHALPSFSASVDRGSPWLILGGGILGSVLLGALIWSLGASRRQSQLMAERMKVELRDSREEQRRMADLVERSGIFTCMCSADGAIRYLNAAGRKMAGLDPQEDVRGRSLFDLCAGAPGSDLREALRTRGSVERCWSGEGKLRHLRTGLCLHVQILAYRLNNAREGEPAWIAVILQDTSERSEKDALLLRRETMLGVLRSIEETFRPDAEWNAACAPVLARLGQVWGADRVRLQRFERPDEEAGRRESSQVWAAPYASDEMRDTRLDSPPLPGTAWTRLRGMVCSEGLVSADLREFSRQEQRYLQGMGIRAMILLPIQVHLTCWGLLSLDSAYERQWSQSEIDCLWVAVRLLGAVLERRRGGLPGGVAAGWASERTNDGDGEIHPRNAA